MNAPFLFSRWKLLKVVIIDLLSIIIGASLLGYFKMFAEYYMLSL